MFQYPQTKICPKGQNVSIPPFCILIICLNNKKDINKKGFYITPSLIFQTFRSTRNTSFSFAKSSCCSAKVFNLHCFQRRNCQTRQATRHFSEQERFFWQKQKIRIFRYLSNCINEDKKLCYAINQSIFRTFVSILRKTHGKLPPVYACMRVYFESLPLSCVTFLGTSRTYADTSPVCFMQKMLTLLKYWTVDNFYI